jgi:CheY-like chemotaxis protein
MQNCTIFEAEGGNEAVAFVKKKADIILMDIQMLIKWLQKQK